MAGEPTRDEVYGGLAQERDRVFADLVASVLTVAAERNPQALRKALAKVYSLDGIAERYDRLLADSETAWQQLQETLDRLRQVNREYKDLEAAGLSLRRLEQENARLSGRVEKLEDTVGKIAAYLRKRHPNPAAKAAQPKG